MSPDRFAERVASCEVLTVIVDVSSVLAITTPDIARAIQPTARLQSDSVRPRVP